MANQTIDLRAVRQKLSPEVKIPETIAWTAHEYVKRERSRYWYCATGAVALILVVFGIINKSYFFSVFVALAFMVMVMYEKKAPRELTFVISEEGVRVGNTLRGFTDFKSFWVFEEDNIRELSLETQKTLAPFLRLPLGTQDSATIREMIRQYLPEEKHDQAPSDHIARGLGF